MGSDTGAIRRAATEAYERRDWPEVLRSLRQVDVGELTGAELFALAEAEGAAASSPDVVHTALELSHAAYLREDDLEGAAWTAMQLVMSSYASSDVDMGRAWEATVGRILPDLPEGRVHAFVAIATSYRSLVEGHVEATLKMVQDARELARRLGDRGLEMWARQREAAATVRAGDFERGLQMLDESIAGAISPDFSPFVRASLLCHGITLCQQVGDLKRAASWIAAGDRATSACGMNFSGECHMHRAEVLKTQGSLARAEAEARLGCEGYEYENPHLGWGWMQLGEIRLRAGDLKGAEDAFTLAYSKNCLPDPGLAMLRLAEGRVADAAREIDRALEYLQPERYAKEHLLDDPQRVRLLSAAVTIRVAAGDLDGARAASDELAALVDVYSSEAFSAEGLCARGELLSAEGRHDEAVDALRAGVARWVQVGAPYEASRARVCLGEALAAAGDDGGAEMELKAAARAFEEIGSEFDERRVASILGRLGGVDDVPVASPRVDRVFMFTDIESSTALATAMGEDEWDRVLQWHDRLIGGCIAENDGAIVKHEGDGVFASFGDEAGAVEAAVAIQERLAAHREQHGFAPAVRIGVHAGQAIERNGDYFGMAVNTAARVMSLAAGGQIVVSDTLADACGERAGDLRSVELKGLGAPTNVVDVIWR